MAQSLPVLMYHYISTFTNSISVSPEIFEEHCKGMAESGWKGITLSEAEAFLVYGEPIPPKSVLITFDDGFLDNYIYAWPILQKYNHHGVIFAVTERLLTQPETRPTLLDVWNSKIPHSKLDFINKPIQQSPLGIHQRNDFFLSWEECRIMEQSKAINIAAHSARHLAVFASPEWEWLYIPEDQLRTFYVVDAPMPWGMPQFKERPALHSRAFIPSDYLNSFICKNVPQDTQEAYTFFQKQQNIEQLKKQIQAIPKKYLGRYENDLEREQRIYNELVLCKDTLEKELQHSVSSFCWPWGSGSQCAQAIGTTLGFTQYYTTQSGANCPKNYQAIRRFKAKNKGWNWLKLRLEIYSRSISARLYSALQM